VLRLPARAFFLLSASIPSMHARATMKTTVRTLLPFINSINRHYVVERASSEGILSTSGVVFPARAICPRIHLAVAPRKASTYLSTHQKVRNNTGGNARECKGQGEGHISTGRDEQVEWIPFRTSHTLFYASRGIFRVSPPCCERTRGLLGPGPLVARRKGIPPTSSQRSSLWGNGVKVSQSNYEQHDYGCFP
jgi:hypothetical protein